MRSFLTAAFLIFVFTATLPIRSRAEWVADGVAVCTSADYQDIPTIASDGAGGAIITWRDRRTVTNYDIYAQRVDAAGTPQWTPDGVALCTAANNQVSPMIVSDGAGGAIVAWQDHRSGSNSDIYAQRVDASGTLQWTPDGVAVRTAVISQSSPTLVSDGAGGAIVAWHEVGAFGTHNDVYAQRVDASGTALWGDYGVAMCTAVNSQEAPMIVSDGAGGAIVTWQDYRSGTSFDIYAQRVDALGNERWTANGVALCTFPYEQITPAIVSDGAGGAIVTWQDGRFSFTDYDIYVQRVNASGTPQWTADGAAVCTAGSNAYAPTITTDGAGGAIVTWNHQVSSENTDISAQRVSATGTRQWAGCGAALCTAENFQFYPTIASDGAGGAIVTWQDYRSDTDYDIYAQRVSASGIPQWTADGVDLCTAASYQLDPAIVSDGAGGAIITWSDNRSGTFLDIYAQRVSASGVSPTGVGNTPSITNLTVHQNHPNPFTGITEMEIELASPSDITVEIYDVTGHRVDTMEVKGAASGWNRLTFVGRDEAGRALPSGVYFYRVSANGETIARKMVIAR